MTSSGPYSGVRLVCLGEVLIDFVPDSSGSSLVDAVRFVKAAGGAPANVAVAAKRLGVGSSLMAAVGDDPFGAFLQRTLSENGVDVSAVATVPQHTALAFVALGPAGERDFMFYAQSPAHDQITVETVEGALSGSTLEGATALHLGSNSLAASPARDASLRAVAIARERAMSVSFDVNYRAPFWPSEREAKAAIAGLLPEADVVKLSLEELALLTGGSTRAAAERFAVGLLAGAARLVCVTLGASGAWYFSAAGAGSIAAPTVQSIDTTGAGDAFMAAILAADVEDQGRWADAEATRLAVGRACAYASRTTTVRGAIPSYGLPYVVEGYTARTGSAW